MISCRMLQERKRKRKEKHCLVRPDGTYTSVPSTEDQLFELCNERLLTVFTMSHSVFDFLFPVLSPPLSRCKSIQISRFPPS